MPGSIKLSHGDREVPILYIFISFHFRFNFQLFFQWNLISFQSWYDPFLLPIVIGPFPSYLKRMNSIKREREFKVKC